MTQKKFMMGNTYIYIHLHVHTYTTCPNATKTTNNIQGMQKASEFWQMNTFKSTHLTKIKKQKYKMVNHYNGTKNICSMF